MLSRHLRTLSITVCVCVAYGPLHTYAQSDPSIEIAIIVAATVAALGADPSSLPPYQEELLQARESADKANHCDENAGMEILDPGVLTKVLAWAVELVKSGGGSTLVSGRPKYTQDLILASIASFEAGRLAASSQSYRENLCRQ